jgi:hypothetical protein
MLSHDVLIDRCLELSPDVRYVAVYRDGVLQSRERARVAGASATESDRYEELLVNPAVLTLVRQRGNIDCGGVRYVLVRYGNFFAFVYPLTGGHVAVALEPAVDLQRLLGVIERKLGEWVGASGAA